MELRGIYSDILAEHNHSSPNRRRLENPTHVLKGVNPSCGDEIELELRVKDGVIEDAAFTGTGCAISQASVSIMADLIREKSLGEALKLAEVFFGMIKNEITDEETLEQLEEAIALRDIAHMPARVKCAVLGWHTLENAVSGTSGSEMK